MRTIHTVRPAHPPAHPRQLLPLASAVARRLAVGLPAHRELRIKTRLHQLLHRGRQPFVARRSEHRRHQRRTLRLAHPARRPALALRERPRQSPLRHHRPQPPPDRAALLRRQARPAVLRQKPRQHRLHQLRKLLRFVHRPAPRRIPPPLSIRPARPGAQSPAAPWRRAGRLRPPTPHPPNCHGHTGASAPTVLVSILRRYSSSVSPLCPMLSVCRAPPSP